MTTPRKRTWAKVSKGQHSALYWCVCSTGPVNIQDRGATYVTGTVEKPLGHDISSVTLLRSSIKRSRCICQQIHGLVFDTTANNTGLKNGTCAFIEHSLDHEMAWVACRYHAMELVLTSIFRSHFGPTRGKGVAIFKRFQTGWPYINQSAYQTASDDIFGSCTAILRAEMAHFC